MKTILISAPLSLVLAGAVRADEAMDALNNALSAYKAAISRTQWMSSPSPSSRSRPSGPMG